MQVFAWIGGAALAATLGLMTYWFVKHPGRKMDEKSKKNPAFIALFVLPSLGIISFFIFVYTR